ncbi:hypothetical protein NPIL_262831 [Nephila pilipes]|uniref:Uncharacterized protein n=1 Tax=Nephila pilipes TaxID=299642 RepID=A0A8X6TWS2_NEPPI|nr:hypothetical protein NPIL_262831 [Nephila pilipes]
MAQAKLFAGISLEPDFLHGLFYPYGEKMLRKSEIRNAKDRERCEKGGKKGGRTPLHPNIFHSGWIFRRVFQSRMTIARHFCQGVPDTGDQL